MFNYSTSCTIFQSVFECLFTKIYKFTDGSGVKYKSNRFANAKSGEADISSARMFVIIDIFCLLYKDQPCDPSLDQRNVNGGHDIVAVSVGGSLKDREDLDARQMILDKGSVDDGNIAVAVCIAGHDLLLLALVVREQI